MSIKLLDIVRFSDQAVQPCLAAKWCAERKITGKVVGHIGDRFEVDVGLPYRITECAINLEFVASPQDAPPTTY